MRIEVGRVGIVPAEIALIDGLRIVAVGAIVAAVGPFIGQRRRRNKGFGDLRLRQPLVHQPDGLVVEIFIILALEREVI